jgi:hypothetical protein
MDDRKSKSNSLSGCQTLVKENREWSKGNEARKWTFSYIRELCTVSRNFIWQWPALESGCTSTALEFCLARDWDELNLNRRPLGWVPWNSNSLSPHYNQLPFFFLVTVVLNEAYPALWLSTKVPNRGDRDHSFPCPLHFAPLLNPNSTSVLGDRQIRLHFACYPSQLPKYEQMKHSRWNKSLVIQWLLTIPWSSWHSTQKRRKTYITEYLGTSLL